MKKTKLYRLLCATLLMCAMHAHSARATVQPFTVHPTAQQIYNSCKEAIALYENKDKSYAMTSCVSEIRGMVGTTFMYHTETRGVVDFEKALCDAMDKKGFVGYDGKDDIAIFFARKIVDFYSKEINKLHPTEEGRKKLKREANMPAHYGIIPTVFLLAEKDCQDYKNKNFGVGVKEFFE